MHFRTTFSIPESAFKIDHQQKILTIGSCFSDEIGSRLMESKFNSFINPFGVIFNPVSIQNLIKRSTQKQPYTMNDVHQNGEQFFCFDVHSSFNSLYANEVLDSINATITEVHNYLKMAHIVIITLGTSWVYRFNETQSIVANCHKVSAKSFEKILLSTEENKAALETIINDLKLINPSVQIIFTVSPVRHIKDGIVENNVSKARLIDAIYQIKQKFTAVQYFPSYELVMDDLRDYRFYKSDLIHPSQEAVNYIWEHFSTTYFTELTQAINQKINKIKLAINHRPFNEASEAHQTFLQKTKVQMEEIVQKYGIDFSAELVHINSKIKSC